MSVNCVIIEDELPNIRRLEKLLYDSGTNVTVLAKLQAVKDAIKWFQDNESPDVIFMDIRLTDGLSFEIYNQVNITAPVVFTTAYDEYALQAFRVNGIDYLLKPIQKEDLQRSLARISQYMIKPDYGVLLGMLAKMKSQQAVYRARFLVTYKDMLLPVNIDEIAYFGSEFKNTFFVTHKGEKYFIEQTMEQVEQELNPDTFFRITRQYIVCTRAVKSIHNYFHGRLKLELQPGVNEEVVVSREKANSFKNWLNK